MSNATTATTKKDEQNEVESSRDETGWSEPKQTITIRIYQVCNQHMLDHAAIQPFI